MSEATGNAWPSLRSASLDWLVRDSVGVPYLDNLLAGLCEHLLEDRLPLSRATLHLRTLHPQFMGARMVWRPGMETAELTYVGYDLLDDPRFRNSPVWALYEGAEGIRQRLDVGELGPDAFDIYADLRDEGVTDYLALPLVATDGRRHACTWATTPLSALRVSKEGFFKLVEQFPQIAVGIMGELASRLYQTTQRLTEVSARLRVLEARERA